ncbi:hypothetical protein M3223_23385 [Paenibacillus pasadenensis]|uniref:hypothetical protein n=1 Tax=Paenibacillus pasadenensis TaxID=217090 RepID=UPI00203E5079|nr:hypothetical protein [Paenibacillus pasadenensis]MCM3750284.1 hypothetical protein [Paenibacillus pasadenensis]
MDKIIIEVDFAQFQQYIECENVICENIKELREEFLTWLYDRKVDHKYWTFKDGIKYALHYDANALVEWLNTIKYSERENKAMLLADPFIALNDVNAKIYF